MAVHIVFSLLFFQTISSDCPANTLLVVKMGITWPNRFVRRRRPSPSSLPSSSVIVAACGPHPFCPCYSHHCSRHRLHHCCPFDHHHRWSFLFLVCISGMAITVVSPCTVVQDVVLVGCSLNVFSSSTSSSSSLSSWSSSASLKCSWSSPSSSSPFAGFRHYRCHHSSSPTSPLWLSWTSHRCCTPGRHRLWHISLF